MDRFVYADNSATTRIDEEVLGAMTPWLTEGYGNASSLYKLGQKSKTALEDTRRAVAKTFNCDPSEIYFTSGGTESDNWAIRGIAKANPKKGKHIITSKIEHHAVLHTLLAMEKEGYEVTYLDVDKYGTVSPEALSEAIRQDTVLVTIMAANNEVGTIQPIDKLGAVCFANKVPFHTDAVQAVGRVRFDLAEQPIDLLSMSAHKIYGPKGVGLLYVRKGVRLANLIEGGGHERGHRSGTENVAGIVGLGKAIELSYSRFDEENERLTKLRERLINGVLKLPETFLTGHPTERLPGHASFSIKYVEGESMILLLDMAGIAASSGSACSSGSLDPSHVLMAMGLTHEEAHGSLRLSLGHFNTEEDVDYILEKLPPIVERLRAMSPLAQK